MNGADVACSIGVLVNVISELWNLGELPTELPEDLGEALEKTGPLDWVDFLQRYLLDNMPVNDEYPEWMASLLEEIAKLVSTEARAVSAGDLVSLPLGQLPDVITAMVEVNKKDFLFIILRVWGMLPQYIRQFAKQRIFTPALKITSVLKQINQAPQNPRDPASDGGHPSGGKASSSSPSETVDTTPTQSLSASV